MRTEKEPLNKPNRSRFLLQLAVADRGHPVKAAQISKWPLKSLKNPIALMGVLYNTDQGAEREQYVQLFRPRFIIL